MSRVLGAVDLSPNRPAPAAGHDFRFFFSSSRLAHSMCTLARPRRIRPFPRSIGFLQIAQCARSDAISFVKVPTPPVDVYSGES
jgi:hypothetical protein